MQVIHVTPFYPPHLGGMENTVRELAERTAEMGHEVIIYTSNRIDNEPKLLSKDNLQIHYLNSVEIAHTPIIFSLPIKLMRNIRKDTIVHIHFAIAYSSEIAMIISKVKRVRVVSHIHIDPQASGSLGFLLPTYKRLFWKRILPLSDVVICPTKDYMNLISERYGVKQSKCMIIPLGVDLKKFNTVSRHKSSDKVTDLLFVGRLSKQKNLLMLLSAFKLLQKEFELTLHIVGDGEERKIIEERIAEENLRNVILHGRVSHEELRNLYQKSDIFVLPSLYESFGLVLLEAMASGLPIVASDISGIRSVVGGCGILVKPTPENFAGAITKLIKNESLREELIRKGKEKVKSYDWDVIAKRTLKVYYSVLSNS
jgi:glycosyltransferase involved in cell wall biosynthesis